MEARGFPRASRPEQHAHEVRADPRVAGSEAQSFGERRLGLGVVPLERGGDGEAVLDPGRRRSASARRSRAFEVLAGRLRALPGERGTPRSEKGFRPGRRRPSRA